MQIIDFNKYAHLNQVINLFSLYPQIFPPVEIELLKSDLLASSSDTLHNWVAVSNEKVVGFVSLSTFYDTNNSWQINWLVVDPKFHRRGCGSDLVNKTIAASKDLNLSQLWVETCSCDNETQARNLYLKSGFKEIARLPDYYSTGHSKVVYLRVISSNPVS